MNISARGIAKKTALSASFGTSISLKRSLKRSAKFCSIPSNLPAYCGPTLSWILAMNFRSTHIMKTVEKRAANVNPGKVVSWKRLFVGSVVVICIMKAMSWLGSVERVMTVDEARPEERVEDEVERENDQAA